MEKITMYVIVGHHSNYDEYETGDIPNVRRKFFANEKISEQQVLNFFHALYQKKSRHTCFWVEKRVPMIATEIESPAKD